MLYWFIKSVSKINRRKYLVELKILLLSHLKKGYNLIKLNNFFFVFSLNNYFALFTHMSTKQFQYNFPFSDTLKITFIQQINVPAALTTTPIHYKYRMENINLEMRKDPNPRLSFTSIRGPCLSACFQGYFYGTIRKKE